MLECQLRKANGVSGVLCDEDRCAFWRVVEQLDAGRSDEWTGCAIQHFSLLEGGEEVAAWLLSTKERVEAEAAVERLEPK